MQSVPTITSVLNKIQTIIVGEIAILCFTREGAVAEIK